MTPISFRAPRRHCLGTAMSMALALWASEAALAQQPAAAVPQATDAGPADAKPAEPKPADAKQTAAKPKPPTQELETVLVIGTRQSQQSAISRKKNAATAQDSIVAEDVGAFPDRNIGEAISRIAGVALDRGDFGEGVNVSIRGNGPELTRVEMDGMAVRSGAGTDLLGGGDGRGTEFRELSSDLIKSVDIVKGTTAAMTEGSLGGGIIITTRTGLDFDKLYYSAKVEASRSDLNKKTTPNFNLVLADRFLDKRLGVIANLSRSYYKNEQHGIAQGGSNSWEGLSRQADFDNSPEKTFTFNPSTAYGDTINTPLHSAPLTAGGTFNAATPVELLTKSASAQTKADCFTLFPNLTTAQTNAISGTTNRTNAYTARQNEQLTCLAQWNDYTPSKTVGFRYTVKSQDDKRNGGDIRLDFKVNDKLTVFGKFARSERHVDDTVGFLGVGSTPTFNAANSFTDNTTANTRALATGVSGSLLPSYSWRASNAPLVLGTTTSILPGYTVDASHHVTSYSTDGGVLTTDTIFSSIDTSNKTLTTGGEYRDGRFSANFMAGSTKSTALRYDRRASYSYTYGRATYALQDNGLWAFTLPDGSNNINQLNYAAYSALNPATPQTAVAASATQLVGTPAYTAAQRGQYTNNLLLQVIRSFDSESTERTGKVDLAYNLVDKVPFLTSLKGGLNFRNTGGTTWNGGGGTLQDPVGTFGTAGFKYGVYMPQVNTRWNVIGCENTAGSVAAGGQPCASGYVPNSNVLNAGIGATPAGTTTMTQAQYQQLIQSTLTLNPAAQFYGGSKDRPATLLDGWNQIDIDKLFAMANIPVRLDCFRRCTASDGKAYDMPFSSFSEKSTAAYLMQDFEVPVWGQMELTGNVGVRVVKTDVSATGFMAFRSVRKNPDWNPTTNTSAVTSYVVSQNTSIKDSSTDVMPSLNLALWPIDDKLALRYGISRTVARPPVSKLLPSGTCTISQVIEETEPDDQGNSPNQTCSGTMGNPALKPQTNTNQNLSLEWYANRDTSMSVNVFRQRGLIGAPTIGTLRNNDNVFSNSSAIDPQTGTPLKDYQFSYAQWDNAPPITRRGIEFGVKTAFTFLPSVLRYTGVDANYSRLRSSQGMPARDLISGDVLPVVNEPKYSWNASLWYDDGAFQARVAMQVVAPRYFVFSPNTGTNLGVNNYPSVGTSSWRAPYNPGAPQFGNMTRYVDAKVSYRFKNGLEIFADVRNLTGERTQNTTGGYQDYADGIPSIYSDGYAGRRYTVGMTLRSPR
ncbi:TonB-dependent receptor [Pelomonas cellulosilytica]|uniref:TonB-dependent receptor n=1 Tax=Pelomonas cellulosilytica TaxID=2906762 RepID=A0ABS8XNJ6_9BURK|nr:TonB-dependent receptor [Pelomonas sp. P8]MCE4554349.1 TonB-dependent receptor [Pelomonas sp. P8]